jgi:hypothetical protein
VLFIENEGRTQPTVSEILTALFSKKCALSALCLLVYHCFSWSWVSSADLHLVETTFNCGFESSNPPNPS